MPPLLSFSRYLVVLAIAGCVLGAAFSLVILVAKVPNWSRANTERAGSHDGEETAPKG